MRVLLDTHILLWFLNDPDLLPKQADEIIFDPQNMVFVSSISLWEIAIKTAIGKLELDAKVSQLEAICDRSNLIIISFQSSHALAVATLPQHHKDPFDRALIVQAQVEEMVLLTHDTMLCAYGSMVQLV